MTPRRIAFATTTAIALSLPVLAHAQEVTIVQPGGVGEDTRSLSAEEAVKLADPSFTEDDVAFMQGMIHHHYQAQQMAALVKGRSGAPELDVIAGRIDASQGDEIAFMRSWLADRGIEAPDPAIHAEHAKMGHMKGMMMPGMATPEQMAELATLEGVAFQQMWLKLMIAHHDGAIVMVDDLLDQPGSAYDPFLADFAADVKNEQQSEIDRMAALLDTLSEDPRSNLAAGFRDAGEAALNMKLVSAQPKAPGFFDPNNPAGLRPEKPADPDAEDVAEVAEADQAAGEGDAREPSLVERAPLFSFSNTDMAFQGNTLFVGNYHGFQVYDLGEDGIPTLRAAVVCPGGQGDVSAVGNLLIMSVEQTRGRKDCGTQGVREDVSPERFRGLRIFDISDPYRPKQVGQVQTCRGSHTHSVISGPGTDGKIIVYNSGTSFVREEKELAGCESDDLASDTSYFSIDVIEIPVANPAAARIVDSPRVFGLEDRVAGLWTGGDHGDGTQDTRRTDQCHDITAFPSKNIAAGACSGNGILLDISNPMEPKRIDAVTDDGFAYWHSATFNNDGTKVMYTDEWGGGGRPRCRAKDKRNWGADAIYDIDGTKLEYRSHYKLPAAQTDKENCVAHNGSIVPVPGRDIYVQAWYQGGISVVDFTDSANPFEIAYFDRGPVDKDQLVVGGYWSAYWYDGKIYGTEITRGLDVLELLPSEYLSAAEIAAAKQAIYQDDRFNPQQQTEVSWPAEVAARALVDQLARAGSIDGQTKANLLAMIDDREPDAVFALQTPAGEHDGLARQRFADLARAMAALLGG
ncbi:DUF305 domain-containing protein [Pseudoblastomonas halimionae]|uniref:DUF305 domain-containing protein n=1 Tax=Alteriqipengyuania halimionae TaxID=1926630 RepID=A0A6I4U8F1_9SPHN|nr:DUF305 domain-containing protein [Alteriqipengyuania halimionae]MXP10631.1 DUF305 domain-containing protein [Alteriqipengyuania halimionae]